MANELSHQIPRVQCRTCTKWAYPDRKSAKHAMKTLHSAERGMQVYRCPTENGSWHIGHCHRRNAPKRGDVAHT